MGQVVLGKSIIMKVKNKALKTYTIIVIIMSFTVLIYCILFYLEYSVTYKYTIDNGFSNTDIIFPKDKRGAEINYLLFLTKLLMSYSIFIIIGLFWWVLGKR